MADEIVEPGGPPGRFDALERRLGQIERRMTQLLNEGREAAAADDRARRRTEARREGPVGRAGAGATLPPTPGARTQGDFFTGAAAAGAQSNAGKVKELSAEERRLLDLSRQLSSSQNTLGGSLAYNTRALGLASTAYRRHGALTTEFIEAAARGQVTFRELGFQVGATIGKFAGWTTAAAAVYGALGAVSALGRGAIQSANGVNQLSRIITTGLDTERAQQQFRDLSREFNLPIEEVAQAAYGSSKIFQDQTRTFEATREALFAVKVGELDAATATRYLNSIVKGFQLDASALPAVFDAINQAQNRFGGNVGDLVAGVAKAGGAFRNAGGDYRELIAILSAGTQLTGQTAEQVATAVQRSVSVLQTPAGQKRARAAGLDPSLPYIDLLRQAAKAARGAGPERVQEIARALVPAGAAFTRIYVPLISNAQRFNNVLEKIQPAQAYGSAQRELARTLRAPSEQIHAIINNLERLGSAFAQAGGLTLFGGFISTINRSLELTTRLVELFNELPRPLREATVVSLQLYGVMRLLRRFDFGDRFAAGAAGSRREAIRDFARPPAETRGRRLVLTGLRDEERFLEDNRQQVARQAALATYQAERARDRVVAAERTNASEATRIQAARRYETAVTTARNLTEDQADLANRIAVVQRQTKEFDQATLRGRQKVAEAARRAGIPYAPGTLERPSPTAPVTPGEAVSPGGVILPGRYAPPVPPAAPVAGESGRLAARTRAFQQQAARLNQSMREGGVAMRSLAATSAGIGNAAAFVGRGATAAATGLRGAGAAVLSALGPLDVFLLGLVATYETYRYVSQKLEESDRQIARLEANAGGLEGIRRRAQNELGQKSLFDRLQGSYATAHNAVTPYGARAASPDQVEDQIAKARLREVEEAQRAQGQGRLLYLPQIMGNLRRRLGAARSRREQQRAIDQAFRELDQSYATSAFGSDQSRRAAADTRKQITTMLADLKAAGGDLQAAMKAIQSPEGLQTFIDDTQARIEAYGFTSARGNRLGAAIARARELIARDPTNIAKYVAEIQEASNELSTQVEQTLNRRLAFAQTPSQQRNIRQEAISDRRAAIRQIQQEIESIDARIERREEEISQAGEELRRAERRTARARGKRVPDKASPLDPNTFLPAPEFGLGDAPNPDEQRLSRSEQRKRDALRALRRNQEADAKALRDLRQQLGLSRADFRLFELQQRQAQFQAEQALFDARTSRLQSETRSPVQQASIAATRLERRADRVRQAYHDGLVSLEEVERAVEAANNAVTQMQQARFQDFQSRQQLATARFSLGANPEDMARRAVQDSYAGLQKTRSLNLGPEAERDALRAWYESRKALADFLRDQARDLISAQAEFQLSRTENPIRQAQIRLNEAQRLFRYAQTPAEKLRARGEVNNRRRDVQQTIQRERYDDIEFESSIGKLTRDQEIRSLEKLLKTIRGNRDLKREIQRRIYQLKNEVDREGALELNVGSVRLPTVYEIRRAVAGGRAQQQGANVTVHSNPRVSVVVNDPGSVPAVARALDDATGTSLESGLRAAGLVQG